MRRTSRGLQGQHVDQHHEAGAEEENTWHDELRQGSATAPGRHDITDVADDE